MAQLFNLSELKNIDKKTRYIVDGFIHESQALFPTDNVYYNIPELINQICLIFYYIQECWDEELCKKHFVINDNTIVLKCAVGDEYNGWNRRYKNAFLSQDITEGIHHYRFKIVNKDVGYGLDIGICKTSKMNALSDYFTKQHENGYAYNCVGGELYGGFSSNKMTTFVRQRCGTNDTIDIFIDLDKSEIRYTVNDKDLGIAFNDIAKVEYRVAVSIKRERDKLQLLLYEQLKSNVNV